MLNSIIEGAMFGFVAIVIESPARLACHPTERCGRNRLRPSDYRLMGAVSTLIDKVLVLFLAGIAAPRVNALNIKTFEVIILDR